MSCCICQISVPQNNLETQLAENVTLTCLTTRHKNYLWWACLLVVQDELSDLNRGTSIDASYQVSVHLAKRFQEIRFLDINHSETRITYWGHVFQGLERKEESFRGPSIDASYQVYLAKRFQKKIKMWKVNRQRTPSDGKNSHYLWQGELKRQSNDYSCTVLIQSIFKSLRIVFPPIFP